MGNVNVTGTLRQIGLAALRINTGSSNSTPTSQVQPDAQSQPTGFQALPPELQEKIMQSLDGPALDSARSVSKNFHALTLLTRRNWANGLAPREGRFTQAGLPTRRELADIGIPRPNMRDILRTLWTTPIQPGTFAAHMQAHAQFEEQVRLGNLVPRIAHGTTDIGPVNDQGQTHGFGVRTYRNHPRRHYEGAFVNGEPQGLGYTVFANGDWHEGNYHIGQARGRGTCAFAGKRYEGMFERGLPHGNGTQTLANGDRYVGMFENGLRHGLGTLTFANGTSRQVLFQNDRPVGAPGLPPRRQLPPHLR